MKQTILVTGGTGFIGSHTTVELQEAGYEVVIIDNLSNSNANVVDGIEKITGKRPAFEKVDCCDMEALEGVFKKYPKIEGIIHFAASKAVGESVEKPLLYYRNNLTSLINLLELMPKYDVKGIIFSRRAAPSTDSPRRRTCPSRRMHPSRRPCRPTATRSRSTRRSFRTISTAVLPSRASSCATSTPSAPIPRHSSASCPTACP